ncbi:MAG: rod-binding protein [Albidovulum sp.]
MVDVPTAGLRLPDSTKVASAFRQGRPSDDALLSAARALEARFLSEMLKAAGLGETPAAFGGGVGEDQFASFLRDEQADAMARQGGIGLAESIFEAMKRRMGDDA